MQPRPFTTVLALGALALMPAAAYASEQPRPEALNQPLSGTVITVFDGDTFAVRDTGGSIWRIRLFGADAPESNQRCTAPGDAANCGRDSGIFLTKQIIGRTISCVPRSISFDRYVASCDRNNRDIARLMVRSGRAVAYRGYSTRYVADEQAAREAHRGIWQGSMETPACFRTPSKAGCPCPIDICDFQGR